MRAHPRRQAMLSFTPVLVALLVLLSSVPPGTAQAPVAVSPGSDTGSAVVSRCAAFSWGGVPDALAYEAPPLPGKGRKPP